MDSELEVSLGRFFCFQDLGVSIIVMSLGNIVYSRSALVECLELSARSDQDPRVDVLDEERGCQLAIEPGIHHLYIICIKLYRSSFCKNTPLSILLLVFLFFANDALCGSEGSYNDK